MKIPGTIQKARKVSMSSIILCAEYNYLWNIIILATNSTRKIPIYSTCFKPIFILCIMLGSLAMDPWRSLHGPRRGPWTTGNPDLNLQYLLSSIKFWLIK